MEKCILRGMFGFILLAIFMSVIANAQDPAAKQGYHLRPGDTIEITVSGEPAYSGEFLLGSSGTIIFADGAVGEISVFDMTPEEAKTHISESLAEYLHDPLVSLRVSKFRVLISGEVQKPGSYEVSAGETVMDAISHAGGPTREVALSVVELRRADATRLLLEPKVFLQTGDISQNLLLQPGDEILVGRSQLGDEFKVSGAVKFPGLYPLPKMRETRLFDAIETAGRWTEEADATKTIIIKKSGDQLNFDLTAIDASPSAAANPVIEPGDEIFVPRKTTQITIQGGVNNPGEYLVEEDTTFLQAVGKAGGLKSNAILKECVLVRTKPEMEHIKINLEKVLRDGEMSENPTVKDGDMLWVAERGPDRQKISPLDIFRTLIWVL